MYKLNEPAGCCQIIYMKRSHCLTYLHAAVHVATAAVGQARAAGGVSRGTMPILYI
jgi:hypothetical protein